MNRIFIILSITMKYLLLIMSSTLIISCEDDVNRLDLPLTESQWEYLDLNGYWVFKDIYNNIDTVYVSSIMEVAQGYDTNPNTESYQERLTLNIGKSRLIQTGSESKLTASGYISEPYYYKANQNSDIYFEPIYLNDIWGLLMEEEGGVWKLSLSAEISEEDTIFLTTNNEPGRPNAGDLWRLNYTLVRGIGLTKYEIILNEDSTYSSSLIDYQIERNY